MARQKPLIAILLLSLFVVGAVTAAAGEKTYKVTVVFMGLMTFDLPPNAHPKEATVILPELSSGMTSVGDAMKNVPKHVAYLLADTTSLPEDHPLNRDLTFVAAKGEGANNVKYVYLPLKGEQISIDDDNWMPTPKPLTYVNSGCGMCPTRDSATAMCWLSSMSEIHDNHPQMKDEDDHFHRFPKRVTVAGRWVLRHGDLNAHVIRTVHVGGGKVVAPTWQFATPKTSGHQDDATSARALAQEVHWTFDATGVPFVLNLLGFDGKGRRVAFMPHDDSLLIVVGNTMPDETGPIKDPLGAPDRDDHYSVYHQFIKGNAQGRGRVPFPVTISDSTTCKTDIFDPILVPKATTAEVSTASAMAHSSAAAGAGTPQPTAGALNCSSSQWP